MSFFCRPLRSSTQIFTKSGCFGARSRTAARASSSVVTAYGTSFLAGSKGPDPGHARPRPTFGRAQRRDDLLAKLVRQLAHVGADADDGSKAVIGVALQVVDEIVAA